MMKLILVFVLTYISYSDACSCLPIVKSNAYCNSQFAGVIRVTSAGAYCPDGSMQTCYDITTFHQLHGTTISPTKLRTNNNPAACGVTLVQGNIYFVATNSIDPDTLGLYLCQLTENWTAITLAQYFTKIDEYRAIRCPIKVVEPIKFEPLPIVFPA